MLTSPLKGVIKCLDETNLDLLLVAKVLVMEEVKAPVRLLAKESDRVKVGRKEVVDFTMLNF